MTDRSKTRLRYVAALTFVAMLVAFGAWRLMAWYKTRDATATNNRPTSARMNELPPEVLWAWERPEDLRFINTSETAIAFLHASVFLSGEEMLKRPRLQPLDVPDGTSMIAVVRIETDRRRRPSLSNRQMEQTIGVLLEASKRKNVRVVQIDFDALATTEREFYRMLLESLRAQLPLEMPLSITALTSWCIGDDWLNKLPIDEAVPMLFRMGADSEQIRNRLRAGEDFRGSRCGTSLGVSTDEMFEQLPLLARDMRRRVYIFNPRSWTVENHAETRRALARGSSP